MARIRTVKPEVVKHETLFDAEQDTGLPIRFAWVMLPCLCDREGRFKWKPRRMKPDLLPYDDGTDVSPVLDAFLARGLVVKYRVRGEWYGWIPTFTKHQVINNRESASELPTPSDADEVIYEGNHELDVCATRSARVNDAQGTPGKRKGREGNKEGKEEIELPSWLPEDAWKEFVAFRQKKAPLTDRAKKLAITELDKLRQEGHDPADVIDQSILHGWRGLWPLKGGPKNDPGEDTEYGWATVRAKELGEPTFKGWNEETHEQFIDRIKRLDREAA